VSKILIAKAVFAMAIFARRILMDPVLIMITASRESATWVFHVNIHSLLVHFVITAMIA
jgi:hypothetical protein